MEAIRLCNICHTRKAELPDRQVTGRMVKRVCRECHSDRLRDDLRHIMEIERRKRMEREGITDRDIAETMPLKGPWEA